MGSQDLCVPACPGRLRSLPSVETPSAAVSPSNTPPYADRDSVGEVGFPRGGTVDLEDGPTQQEDNLYLVEGLVGSLGSVPVRL